MNMRNGIEPETYSSLGLYESNRIPSVYPRVLQFLASVLERLIQKNRKLVSRKEEEITVFHGSKSPSLSIQQYIERIFRYSKCSASCFVVALIYIDRFLHKTNAFLTPLNVHRLLITSIMLAAKFLDDECYNNAYYAKVGGVSTEEMNRMEMNLLFKLDFKLQVTVEEFNNYCLHLQRETEQSEHQIYAGSRKGISQHRTNTTINTIWQR